MIEGFKCYRQQTAESCLPTCVFGVLDYYGFGTSMDEVSTWCQVDSGGSCSWDLAVHSIQDHLNVEYFEGDWERVRSEVIDNEIPVIVTIAEPGHLLFADGYSVLRGDHAVVIVHISHAGDAANIVQYMDPEKEELVEKSIDLFLMAWDLPGARCLVINR